MCVLGPRSDRDHREFGRRRDGAIVLHWACNHLQEPNYSERMEMGGLNADNHRDIATKSSRGKETPRRGQDTLEIWDGKIGWHE